MLYQPVIGLEIHLQLATASKMFCRCSNRGEFELPNTTICPICLGHPGTLPSLNRQAVEWGMLLGLAVRGDVQAFSKFDRKSYFYPDLPKGYQISQYDQPLVLGGYVMVESSTGDHQVNLERIHLEEDTAKLIHDAARGSSLADFNRAGSPLLEMVTRPDIDAPATAAAFLRELRQIVRLLGVSDGDMEKGHLRCDANISLRPVGDSQLYPKTEVKNMNSFKAVEKALLHEIERQTVLWERGEPPTKSSTRGWDEGAGTTVLQRVKEGVDDYRFFPEPDLPPLIVADGIGNAPAELKPQSEFRLSMWSGQIPELPFEKRQRFRELYGINAADAAVLCDDYAVANYFEKAISELRGWLLTRQEVTGSEEEVWASGKAKLVKLVNGWLTTELFKLLNVSGQEFSTLKITPENFAQFLVMLYERRINSSSAQILLAKMFDTGADPEHLLEELDLKQVSDSGSIEELARQVVAQYPAQVAEYRAGKAPVLKFLLGALMKLSKGKADPGVAEEALKRVIG